MLGGDGRYIVIDTKARSGNVFIEVEEGGLARGLQLPDTMAAARFAPVGTWLAYSHLIANWRVDPPIEERRVYVLDYRTGSRRLLHQTRWNAESEWFEPPPVWSHDARYLRVADDRTEDWGSRLLYHLFDVQSSELVTRVFYPNSGPELLNTFVDTAVSAAGRFRVLTPEIPEYEYGSPIHGATGEGLQVARIHNDDENTVLTDGEVFSWQWHPAQEILLYASGRASDGPESPSASDVYVAVFE